MHPNRFRRLSIVVVLALVGRASGQDFVRSHLLNFHDNGAWSWFEDERAIVDAMRGRILVSSCADNSGLGGSARQGDIDIAWLDIATGTFGAFELNDRLQGDDHNSASLLVRPDGRYLAMYGTHGGSGAFARRSRWRVSTAPGDPTSWAPESVFTHAASMSYSNLFHLRATGRTYNFTRAVNYDPNVMVSTDQGTTWSGTGKLLTEGGGSDRPYLKYASDGESRIHLLATERHPRNFDNSIYHGFVEGDRLHDSRGRLVDANILDGAGQPPRQLTTVFQAGTVVGGVTMRRCWTIDMAVDAGNQVRILFQTRANGSQNDHRLFFGRFDGLNWTAHEVCRMGGGLYGAEQDYTGLGALHPNRADTMYLSTPIDPRTGAATSNHEIYKAETANQGQSWTFTPVTEQSSVDNLRPIIPSWDQDRTAVLWMRGTYSTYTNYDLAVVGVVEAPELTFGKATYVDAAIGNTMVQNGVSPTGPAAGQGATDQRWHLRTGFGNGGYVWTSGERGAEDAAELRTRLTGLTPGLRDVFLVFWSNPTEDWAVRAGFESGNLRNLEKRGAAALDPTHFATAPQTTGATVRAYSVWLGRREVGANGTLDVYVDDFGAAANARAWYDGIGVAPVACRATSQQVGLGCAGSQRLQLSGNPVLGTTVDLTLEGASTAGAGMVLLGGGALRPAALDAAGFPGCVLLVEQILSVPLGVLGPGGSTAPVSLAIPNDPSLRCVRVGLQGGVLGATLGLTPALLLLPGS